jgi:predicted secreted protein
MADIVLTESNNGGQITAHIGDTVVIELAENATTGYQWVLEQPDSALFAVRDKSAHYPNRGLGSAGSAQFRVSVTAAGTGTLRLVRRRSWEKDAEDQPRFSVEVAASPA